MKKANLTKMIEVQALLAKAAEVLQEIGMDQTDTVGVQMTAKAFARKVSEILHTRDEQGIQDLLNHIRANGGAQ